MNIITRVLAWHSTGNLIITDGPCLLVHQVKKGEDSMWTHMQMANYYMHIATIRGCMCN